LVCWISVGCLWTIAYRDKKVVRLSFSCRFSQPDSAETPSVHKGAHAVGALYKTPRDMGLGREPGLPVPMVSSSSNMSPPSNIQTAASFWPSTVITVAIRVRRLADPFSVCQSLPLSILLVSGHRCSNYLAMVVSQPPSTCPSSMAQASASSVTFYLCVMVHHTPNRHKTPASCVPGTPTLSPTSPSALVAWTRLKSIEGSNGILTVWTPSWPGPSPHCLGRGERLCIGSSACEKVPVLSLISRAFSNSRAGQTLSTSLGTASPCQGRGPAGALPPSSELTSLCQFLSTNL
jgi:hypothetical protein